MTIDLDAIETRLIQATLGRDRDDIGDACYEFVKNDAPLLVAELRRLQAKPTSEDLTKIAREAFSDATGGRYQRTVRDIDGSQVTEFSDEAAFKNG